VSARSDTVSVIIPTYNRAHTLVAAIESALTQTTPALEVLVCDDGSTDATREVVEALADERVRFLACGRNGRPAIVRNRGIADSRGEWLAFLDSDDAWLPDKLTTQLAMLRELDCLASSTNATRLVPGHGLAGTLLTFDQPRLTFALLLRSNLVVCSSAMFHRSLLPFVGGFPEHHSLVAAEDYALWLKVATRTDFAFVSTPQVVYTDDPAASIRGVDPAAEQTRAGRLRRLLALGAPALPKRARAALGARAARTRQVQGSLAAQDLSQSPWKVQRAVGIRCAPKFWCSV
jgi:glycosyltransferase involved in cell wall biosynthesis